MKREIAGILRHLLRPRRLERARPGATGANGDGSTRCADDSAVLGDALAGLYARVPLGMRLGLEPMREACARFGHPERAFESRSRRRHQRQGQRVRDGRVDRARGGPARRALHVAAPLPLRRADPDRRRADRRRARSTDILERALDGAPELSFFETATLAAFLAFRDAQGGPRGHRGRHRRPARRDERLAATPRAAAITRIALDHTDRLGPTLVDIAREKAGIAKPGAPTGRSGRCRPTCAQPSMTSRSRRTRPRRSVDDRGVARAHRPRRATPEGQRRESPSALGGRIGASAARDRPMGCASVRWPGRLERIAGPARRAVARLPARRRPQPGRRRGARAPPARRWQCHRRERRARLRRRSATRTGPPCSTRWLPSRPRASTSLPRGSRAAIDPASLAARHARRRGRRWPPRISRATADAVGTSLVVVAGLLVLRRRGARAPAGAAARSARRALKTRPRCGYIGRPGLPCRASTSSRRCSATRSTTPTTRRSARSRSASTSRTPRRSWRRAPRRSPSAPASEDRAKRRARRAARQARQAQGLACASPSQASRRRPPRAARASS